MKTPIAFAPPSRLIAWCLLAPCAGALADTWPCDPVTDRQSLFSGEIASLQERGEWQVTGSVSRQTEGAAEPAVELEAEYGVSERVQLQAGIEAERSAEGETERTLSAGAGIGLRCTNDGLTLRLDLAAVREHDAGTEGAARLIAGAPFAYGSWHAGATRGTTRALRSYFGAAILETDFRPLAVEARRESDGNIWKTLFSAGLYLFTTETMELAVGLSQLHGEDDPERRLMLKFTGEF